MKHITTAAGFLAATTSLAMAGGVDRSGQGISALFEEGNYVELSYGYVSPDVTGQAVAIPAPGLNSALSGSMSNNFSQVGLAYKHQFNDRVSAALIFDQPFGADVTYPTGTGYFAQGASAELKTNALTALVRYKFDGGFSVHGGLRYQELEARANIPFVAGYTANGSKDGGIGYTLGIAYEKPEIALRVALTYNSEIDHDLSTVETIGGAAIPGTSNTAITTPASWNLDFQTGIAANTLLFGSIRYAENTTFQVAPVNYPFNPLVSFNGNGQTYNIGVGRRFNETWSGAISLGYDKETGGLKSNLAPTDGNISIGLGATYTQDALKITGGIRYIDIGNAQTGLGAVQPATNFDGNSAVAVGIKIGYSF